MQQPQPQDAGQMQQAEQPQQQQQQDNGQPKPLRRCSRKLSAFDMDPGADGGSSGGGLSGEAQAVAEEAEAEAEPCYGFDVLVSIVRAMNLPGQDWWNGLADPFVEVVVLPACSDGSSPSSSSSSSSSGGDGAGGAQNGHARLRYRTRTAWRDLNPKYTDEFFEVGNLREGSRLEVEVWDRDLVTPNDLIGKASWEFRPKEGSSRGRFHLVLQLLTGKSCKPAGQLEMDVHYQPSESPGIAAMLGPVRFRQHTSRVTGFLMRNWNDDNTMGYSCYKIFLCHIPAAFEDADPCPWNRAYKNAVSIFKNPVVLGGVRQTHANLYATHHLAASRAGVLRDTTDFFELFNGGTRGGQRRYFTYTLMPDSLRCSETGAAFMIDMMSKHAMHAGGAEEVLCAGEFCIVPDAAAEGGYRLVIDNNSGTYAPAGDLLPCMQRLFQSNFPQMSVEVVPVGDPRLEAYHQRCPSRS